MKHSQQRGLTLIELMVALVISLLIMAGLFTVYKSNQRGNRLNDGLMRTQENGRFAIDFLSRDIRRASFPASDTQVAKFLFQGSANDVVDAVNHPSPSDVLHLRHGAVNLTTQDCSGWVPGDPNYSFDLNTVPLGQTTLNQYDIQNTGRTNNRGVPIFALFCNNIELIEGIENMQVLYGVDTSVPRDFVANRYVTFGNIPDIDNDPFALPDWARVVSLRIALLASSVDEKAGAPSQRTFSLLAAPVMGPYDGTGAFAADQKIRRVYTTTVLIRNNMVNK